MKYKIEIWKYHKCIDEYESNDIDKIRKWFRENYGYTYVNGGCCYYIYKNNKRLSFEEEQKLDIIDIMEDCW